MIVAPNRLVFVAGLHRSGTTPLADLLGQHPEISSITGSPASMNEGQHLQDVYPSDEVYGGAGRFAWHRRAHLTEESPLVSADNAQRMLIGWVPFWDVRRRLLVEKSPPNLVQTRFLQALYPAARFVVIIRHPIVSALAHQKWMPKASLAEIAAHHRRALRYFEHDRAHIRRLHVLRYEDLVARPGTVLDGLAEFLELRSPLNERGVEEHHSAAYQQRWAALAEGSRAERRVRRRVQRIVAPLMTRYGYDAETLGLSS